MMIEYTDNLEAELAGLTAPTGAGGVATLWKSALAQARGGSTPERARPLGRHLDRPLAKIFSRGALAAAAGIVLCGVLLTAAWQGARVDMRAPAAVYGRVAVDKSEGFGEGEAAGRAYMGRVLEDAKKVDAEGRRFDVLRKGENKAIGGSPVPITGYNSGAFEVTDGGPLRMGGNSTYVMNNAAASQVAPQDQAIARMVVRQAQIELKSADVRTVFFKATMVLSEAQGEYVEESGLSGQDAVLKDGVVVQPSTLTATLKLRVAANRLANVLQSLRDLGAVMSETAGGEDVTEQVVDLEARMRNEQAVEAELLGLLASRKDAALEDVLKLRESIGRVRENIERMTAQRERLGRLVSLATVLVVIRSDAAPVPEPRSEGLGDYFARGISNAWERGVRGLADSAAWLVRVAVGGAPAWAVLAVVVLGLRLAWRRYQRALAAEPAPKGV